MGMASLAGLLIALLLEDIAAPPGKLNPTDGMLLFTPATIFCVPIWPIPGKLFCANDTLLFNPPITLALVPGESVAGVAPESPEFGKPMKGNIPTGPEIP
jgi:hypothetical protein